MGAGEHAPGYKHTRFEHAPDRKDEIMDRKSSDQTGKTNRSGWRNLHACTLENDIRYRGPLTYGGFQILGWCCIVLASVYFMTSMATKINPDLEPRFSSILTVLIYIAPMSLPFLLLANFAKILNHDEGYKGQLLMNFSAMAGIFLAFLLLYQHFFVGAMSTFADNPADTDAAMTIIIEAATPRRFTAFNIFVDLFLCTIFMLFLNHRPTKIFTGKKIIIFRLFAILPVAYEVVCMIVKERAFRGLLTVPPLCYPLLTVKPVMTFVEFILLAFFIKFREYRFCCHGKTYEDYQEFLKTNRNSLHFSVFTAITMLLLGLLDLFIYIYLLDINSVGLDPNEWEDVAKYTKLLYLYPSIGLGNGTFMAFVAPVVLLFSYTRHPKFRKFRMFIPVIGVVLIILVVLQGAYQMIRIGNYEKVDILGISRKIADVLHMLQQ